VRVRNQLVPTTVIVNLFAVAILIYRQLNGAHVDLWSIIPYGIFLVFLLRRARALKKRVAELVDLAAYRTGMQRISRRMKKSPTNPVEVVEEKAEPAAL
jgi:hypothetical protein